VFWTAECAPTEPKYQLMHPILQRHFILIREVNVIKKVSGGYKVVSKKGKNLGGPYKSKAAAKKRLQQVEFFKRAK
jgi:hypothetical protein